MDKSIYEVSRAEYTDFINSIVTSARKTFQVEEEENIIINTYNANETILYASRVISKDHQEETCYIFELPPQEDRQAPLPIRRIELSDRKQVQDFLNAVAKISKENK